MTPEGWVLYDGACGVCSRWVPRWAPTLSRMGLGVAPLQDTWVAERLGLVPGAPLSDIHLLFADGRDLAGGDVYRYIMRRIWWAYPLYLLSIAPIARRIFDAAYRTFANHRHGISASCGLNAQR
jgi:predicted DCC family thiol-disulfide oxidoreductase YuxK